MITMSLTSKLIEFYREKHRSRIALEHSLQLTLGTIDLAIHEDPERVHRGVTWI